MYVIRETFVAKPGQASKLAKMFNEIWQEQNDLNVRVMTDFVGPFNTVVMETEVESLEEYGRRMKEYATDTKWHDRMKGYTEMYLEGKREIYQLVTQTAHVTGRR